MDMVQDNVNEIGNLFIKPTTSCLDNLNVSCRFYRTANIAGQLLPHPRLHLQYKLRHTNSELHGSSRRCRGEMSRQCASLSERISPRWCFRILCWVTDYQARVWNKQGLHKWILLYEEVCLPLVSEARMNLGHCCKCPRANSVVNLVSLELLS